MRKAQNLSPHFVVALLFMLCLGSLKLRLNFPAFYETRSETQLLVIYVNTLWLACAVSHRIRSRFSSPLNMADAVDQKLLKATKFPPEFSQRVDMKTVNVEVLKK